MVRFDGDAGGVVVDGEAYALRQMHWHSPSEHAVDGRRYDLELHMLHQSETRNGRYAVVARHRPPPRRHPGHGDHRDHPLFHIFYYLHVGRVGNFGRRSFRSPPIRYYFDGNFSIFQFCHEFWSYLFKLN
jgi:hypothetical protein